MSSPEPAKPSAAVSIAIFVIGTLLMAWLRLHIFRHEFVSLTYGLPLLLCLWHRDRQLLWSLAAAFVGMATYKAFFVFAPPDRSAVQWAMQVVNIAIVGGTVHAILNLTDRLRAQQADLAKANEELTARNEEITRQNEELQAQSEELARQNEQIHSQTEELAQQNEILQQQSEETQQQSEELQAQTEELQGVNAELVHREAMLQALLQALRHPGDPEQLLQHICAAAVKLFGGRASAAAIVEKQAEELVVSAHADMAALAKERWHFENSFAAIIVAEGRTAFIADLRLRKDLSIPKPKQHLRSILATPLRVSGKVTGAVEIYSEQPREWTTEDFKVIEWIAAQCSLVLETIYLHRELTRSNLQLEQTVKNRTTQLQEMVDELEHFSYSITHDMRAPLRAMQGYAALLQECDPIRKDEEASEFLRRIITAAARMDRLILDSLSYSQSIRGEMTLHPINSELLLKGIIESYPAFQSPNAEIKVQGSLPVVLANEAGLTQCFSNLLSNAVKFVTPGEIPRVTIRAERRDRMVRLWFEDQGIGVPAEMKSRIFNMFQRASKDYEGTGIGLALVRKVAERMGGGVGFESELGKGSQFWIELQCAA